MNPRSRPERTVCLSPVVRPSFARQCVRWSPTLLLGHITAPTSVLPDNRLPPTLLICTRVRHQTPRIPAAPARTDSRRCTRRGGGDDRPTVVNEPAASLAITAAPGATPSTRTHPHLRLHIQLCVHTCVYLLVDRGRSSRPCATLLGIRSLPSPTYPTCFSSRCRPPPLVAIPLFAQRPFRAPCSVAPACISSCRLRFVASPMSPRAVHVFFAHSSMA